MKLPLWTLVLAMLLPIAAIAQIPANGDLAKENAKLREQVKQLQKENAQLRAQLQQQTQKTTALEQEKAQQQQQLRDLFLSTDYDSSADRTTVYTTSMKLKMLRGNGNDHWLTLAAVYPGKQPTQPVDHVTLTMAAWFAGDLYRNADTLTLDIDGEKVECPITDYQVQRRVVRVVKKTIDRSDAILTADVPMSAVRKIGSASKVTGQIGHVQFQFPREINEACQALSQALPQ